MKEDIIIMGRGGHAKVVIDIIEEGNEYNIIGITDVDAGKNEKYMGYPVLGNDDVLPHFFEKGVKNAAMGIGGYRNNDLRTKIFNKAKALGYNIPVLIHPSAIISRRAKIGEGTVIFQGVILNTEVIIGRNCVLATGARIDHESVIKDNVLISAGVTIGANNIINNGVLCALGSKVISAVEIGENITVGAGAVVVNNLKEKGIYLGCPAKIKKDR